MLWNLGETAVEDFRWFGKKVGRQLLKEAVRRLSADPLVETLNMKNTEAESVCPA
jgi:hypothetical protein